MCIVKYIGIRIVINTWRRVFVVCTCIRSQTAEPMFVNYGEVVFAGETGNGCRRIVPAIAFGIKVRIGNPIVTIFYSFFITPENIDTFCIPISSVGITGRKVESCTIIEFRQVFIIFIIKLCPKCEIIFRNLIAESIMVRSFIIKIAGIQ